MRVATVDGLVTLYYDGSKELFNQELENEWWIVSIREQNAGRRDDIESLNITDECKEYIKERLSWHQIIIVEGVIEIPEYTFSGCKNIKRVIFANTVISIQGRAFLDCKSLVYIKWSLNLEYVGKAAFLHCNLSSVFMPPRCREICEDAFTENEDLIIFHVPQDTELGIDIIASTALAKASSMERDDQFIGVGLNIMQRFRARAQQRIAVSNNINQWLKSMNNDDQFALHRTCSSFHPLKEIIHTIIQEKGLKAFREENSAGITPSKYLQENPYANFKEKDIICEYLMKKMGEVE